MSNEEALQIVISAAHSLAELKIDGEMISFSNDWDFQHGEEIRQALAHLTKRAVDVANVAADGLALHNVLNSKVSDSA